MDGPATYPVARDDIRNYFLAVQEIDLSFFSGGHPYEMREQRAGETIGGSQASTLIASGTVTAGPALAV